MTLVSVLCPTRGREMFLHRSLDSLFSLADDPSRVEVLLAVDPDEPEPPGIPGCSVRTWRAPERYGYRALHEYFNRLAGIAAGRWLMIWNDDAVMATSGWDTVIAGQKPAHLFPSTSDGPPHCNAFPAWPGEWTRILGHVSLEPYADSWMQIIAESLGLQVPVPILVKHTAPDDQTWREGRGTAPPWTTPGSPGLSEDAARLGRYLAGDA